MKQIITYTMFAQDLRYGIDAKTRRGVAIPVLIALCTIYIYLHIRRVLRVPKIYYECVQEFNASVLRVSTIVQWSR